MWSNDHFKWLIETGEKINLPCGKQVPVLKFNPVITDKQTMSNWARHFRNYYCSDEEIDQLKPTKMSRMEYLLKYKFPNESRPGPCIKAGDFVEILVADYLEY